MKKTLIYISTLALLVVGCSIEIDTPIQEEPILDGSRVEYSFKTGAETKGVIDFSDGSFTWEKDDAIALWDSKNSTFDTFTAKTAGVTTVFTGTGAADAEYTVAYYPASIASDVKGANTVTWPDSYSSVAEAAKSAPLRAVLDEDMLYFKHLGAVLRITINDVPAEVTSLVFSTSNVVTGDLGVNVTVPALPKCEIGAATPTTVTISSDPASRTSGTTEFYLPLPVGTLTAGFSILLKNGSTTVSTKTTTNDVEIARAKYIKMKAFTPEGDASDWYILGGFNSWSGLATRMYEVLGHDGWLVARKVNTTPAGGQSPGFKFYYLSSDTWKGGDGTSLHTEYSVTGSDINPANNTYDIYFNPSAEKYFLAYAGEPWTRTLYLMTDMELSDLTYKLHTWYHDTGTGITAWPGKEGTTETISGIKYYKFSFNINSSDYPCAGPIDCVFHSSDDTRRYDFRDGALTITNNDGGDYYASFTSATYDGNHGDGNTNPMTQFTDPAAPQGASNWDVYINSTPLYMQWDNGPVLVRRDVTMGPTSKACFRYIYQDRFFAHNSSVSPDTEFSVTYTYPGSRSSSEFDVPTLDGEYVCDLYLDPVNNTAKVVPIVKTGNITLYFGVPNPGTYVNYYTFNGRSMSWPGLAITTNYETINGVNYYKAVLPGTDFWNTAVKLIVVSDGIADSQTHDFETADWSGYKSEYWFYVDGKDIIQLSERPVDVSSLDIPTIDGKMSDWNDYPALSTGSRLAVVKAVADKSKLYIYQRWTDSDCSYDRSGSYQYVSIDSDNNASTGPSSDGEILKGADSYWKFYFYRDDPKYSFLAYKVWDSGTSAFVDPATAFSGEDFQYKINTSIGAYEIEYSVPLNKIGAAAGVSPKIIRVGMYGYTPSTSGGSTSFKANYFNVTIPAAD